MRAATGCRRTWCGAAALLLLLAPAAAWASRAPTAHERAAIERAARAEAGAPVTLRDARVSGRWASADVTIRFPSGATQEQLSGYVRRHGHWTDVARVPSVTGLSRGDLSNLTDLSCDAP
jgi:hypothetical protein